MMVLELYHNCQYLVLKVFPAGDWPNTTVVVDHVLSCGGQMCFNI